MKENKFTEINEDSISLDEQGKVVIQDEGLAKVIEELTLDELAQVLGATIPSNFSCYGPIDFP